MRKLKFILYVLSLASICSLAACKLTEAQIRSLPPEYVQQNLKAEDFKTEATSALREVATKIKDEVASKRPSMGVIWAGVALLIGAILYFKADDDRPMIRIGIFRKKRKRSSHSKSRKKR